MNAMRRIVHWGAWSALAALISVGVVWSASPVKKTAPDLRRRSAEVKNHRQIPWVNDRPAWGMERPVPVTGLARRLPVSLRASSANSPGIVVCAENPWDFQHNDGTVRQLATLGDGELVHFGFTLFSDIPDSINDPDRMVYYNAYDATSGLVLGDCGDVISGAPDAAVARGGYATVDVSSDGAAHPSFHQRDDYGCSYPHLECYYSTWMLDQAPPPNYNAFNQYMLPQSDEPEAIWPHLTIDRGGSAVKTPGDDVYHVCSRASGDNAPYTTELFYWRRVGITGAWEGPVVLDFMEGGSVSHHVATDPTDENVAVVFPSDDNAQQLMFLYYLESADNGADWITTGIPIFPTPVGPLVNGGRHQVAGYIGGDGPQAWYDCTGEYDSQGNLHIVWVEQALADNGDDCYLMHWSAATHKSYIATALGWLNAGNTSTRSLWMASPQIGFGDGNTLCTDGPANPGGAGATSNLDYIYVTFTRYGGPTSAEANDVSTHNYQNAEIYLSVSNDHGGSWSRPVNLTNTQTPGCDGTVPGSECASEIYPSINLIVDDTIHLSYFLDTDAGSAVFGQGSWTNGQVMYYRIPGGTDTEPLCPDLTPCLGRMLSDSDPDCEYHATLNPPGTVDETLLITNCGNDLLTGSVGVSPPSATWLQVSSAPFSIPSGGPGNYDIRPVTMDAGDASITGEGLYSAQIEITHNDPNTVNPFPIPVDFFVFDVFFCPEYETLHTDCLWLEVSNIERIGNQNQGLSGLTRLGSDSSWSVYDGSLIIGVPPNPDTLVYRTVYGWGNGYPGFRALGNLMIDTSAYGTFTGEATASAVQTTSDSTIGINVEYVFSQDPDSCDFVLIKYRITNNSASDMLNLAVGEAVDFDVMPGVDESALQTERENYAAIRSDFNLVYQYGADTAGHVIVGDNTAERWKAGMTQISCWPSPRAWIAPNDPWLYGTASCGFEEGYLYQEMTKSGFEIFNAPLPQDLHSVLVFDNDLDLVPGESKSYTMGLVSSNTGTDASDLINTTQKAWRYAFGWQEFVTDDTIPDFGTPRSYPYRAVGTHEGGLDGGCCGCIVEKVEGSGEFTVVPGPDPCEGTIEFGGGQICCHPWYARFRVSDLCRTYSDEFVMIIQLGYHMDCWCICDHQSDFDSDYFVTALDLAAMIDILFAGRPDVQDDDCPGWRGDFDCDCFTTALDLSKLIDHLFAGGQAPCNPCVTGTCGPQCP